MTQNTTTTPGTNGARDPETRVFILERAAPCVGCCQTIHRTDAVTVEGHAIFCLTCSGLDGLELFPAGNPSISRQLTQCAERRILVFRRPVHAPRRRHERIGMMATPEEIQRARERSEFNAARRALTLDLPMLEARSRAAREAQAA
jgi:hypothetical protein